MRTVHNRLTFPLLPVSAGSNDQYFCLESSPTVPSVMNLEGWGVSGWELGWGVGGEEWRESGPFDEHQVESVVENRACLLLSVLFIQTRTTTSLNARSHAALTQRVAANLAWRKHGFQLNGGSDAAPRRWEGRAAARGHRLSRRRRRRSQKTGCPKNKKMFPHCRQNN